MINSLNKYDIAVVKFPFASSIKYKARPAVIILSDLYHKNGRNTVIGTLCKKDRINLDSLLENICFK
jgi:mRNA-degrading endonuclease toxin of MazEF toxin-antitoxin module